MEDDYKEHSKGLKADDYWGQIKRTVHGQPVSEEQIEMIVDGIVSGLSLKENGSDVLLDLGCGNGALSERVFSKCKSFHGVDYSEFLISVAKRDFEKSPDFEFELGDVDTYLKQEKDPERFNKTLCYGCFSYFKESEAVLGILAERFSNLSHVFIGNLPDRDKASLFYTDGVPGDAELKDPDSKIGIWRTQEEFSSLAAKCGWDCTFHFMPKEFYAAHYRYDVTLTRGI